MKTNEPMIINIAKPEIVKCKIRIVGDSPLVVHCWSEKAKKEMLDAMQGTKNGKKREPKDPVAEFIDSMYWISGKPEEKTEEGFAKAIASGNARFGFPAIAIKKCANAAAYRCGWVPNQTGLRAAYFIETDVGDLVEIHGSMPVMREDPVTVGIGGKDLRYRGEFQNWFMDLTICFNKANANFSAESIINIIANGGFSNGIGEWRIEKDGRFGQFHVETINE